MIRFLSHVHSVKDPVFPGNVRLSIPRYQFSYDKGDPCQQFVFEMCNHIGTHMDFPRHFNPNGKTVDKIRAEELVFDSIVLLDIPKNDSEMLTREDLEPHRAEVGDAEMLLIRTGFEACRDNEERFAKANPALHESFAQYLVDDFPALRAFGFDSISAGNSSAIPTAIAVHQKMLGYPSAEGRYIFIIEDMSLKDCPRRLDRVVVAPLRIEGADGMPCTIFAFHQ